MEPKRRNERDENEIAADAVHRATARLRVSAGGDTETAWETWSRQLQRVDARTMTLLRAAFEAGAASVEPASALGKLGAAKGGRARAEKLTATKRRSIARKAARARWKAV